MAKEDYLFRLSMFEQEASKLEEQLQIINQQILEFEILKQSVSKLENLEKKEILANLGRGIFFKTELKDKKLFVNVGSGIVLKKTGEETIEVIDKQVKQLSELKQEIEREMMKLNLQLQELVEKANRDAE